MLFNSYDFLLFFVPVFLCWLLAPVSYRWLVLLVASLVFYGWAKPAYLMLLGLTIGVNYYCALSMEQNKKNLPVRRWLLYVAMFVNLGVLIVFKYLGFFSEIALAIAGLFHAGAGFKPLELLLPIGISFYTFQSIGYILDVYYGVRKPEKHFGYFALFVSFFPQILSGPIGRSNHLLPQISQPKTFSYDNLGYGLQRFAWGLFKKLVIADRLDAYVNDIYNNVHDYPGSVLWLGTFLFAFQLYCDFSGYTDMAIGLARMFGYNLLENFNFPFISQNVTEFWRRWHISLSAWLRDYLYTPIQFSKKKWKKGATVYAISLTFLICGLWHGAKFTFVMFGVFQSAALVYEMLTRDARQRWSNTVTPYLYKPASWLITFVFTLVSFVFFRANTTPDAFFVLKNQFVNFWDVRAVLDFIQAHGGSKFIFSLGLLGAFILGDFFLSTTIQKQDKPAYALNFIFTSLVVLILLFGSFGKVDFIYFQF